MLRQRHGTEDDEKLAMLGKSPVFAGLSQAALKRIAAISAVEERDSPAVLAVESEIPRYLYLLVRGQIGFSARTSDGKSSIVDVLNPPEFFPLASGLTTKPLLGGIHVLSPALLLRIAALELRELVKTDTEIGMAMVNSLSSLNRTYYVAMTDMKIRSAAQRLGSYIFSLSREQGDPDQVRLPMSKQFLASRLGTTPENLSRCFAGLRAHGIETSGSRIQITDPKRLAAFIAPAFDH